MFISFDPCLNNLCSTHLTHVQTHSKLEETILTRFHECWAYTASLCTGSYNRLWALWARWAKILVFFSPSQGFHSTRSVNLSSQCTRSRCTNPMGALMMLYYLIQTYFGESSLLYSFIHTSSRLHTCTRQLGVLTDVQTGLLFWTMKVNVNCLICHFKDLNKRHNCRWKWVQLVFRPFNVVTILSLSSIT